MGKMTIHIDDDVEKAFRIWLAQRGGKKGDISIEIERILRRELKMKEKLKGGK